MHLLSPSLTLRELPVVAHVYDGQHEELVLVKDLGADKRAVLRLWATRCAIIDGPPVWTGDLSLLRKENIVDLIALPLTDESPDSAQQALQADLAATPALASLAGEPVLVATRDSGLLRQAPKNASD